MFLRFASSPDLRALRPAPTDDIHLFNANLREWEDYYNYPPAARGLGGSDPVRAAPGKGESRSLTGALRTYKLRRGA